MVKSKSTSFGLIGLLILGIVMPAYGEVITFSTNSEQYDANNDEIVFSGTVDDNSDVLVTIVIRNPNDKFVMLTQALIQSDNTYEKIVKIDKKFSLDGMYNSTAFITNMTLGKIANFEYAYDGFPEKAIETKTFPEINEPITELNEIEKNESEISIDETQNKENKTPSFVDPEKDPIHYVERYYNESIYREWFDKNYPELTIEEAVGYVPTETTQTYNEIKTITPTANAALMSPNISTNDELEGNEFAHMVLAMGGIVVLLGAVYGVRSKFDGKINVKSKKSSLVKKKFFSPIIGHEPLDVIKNRLAKGDIDVEEYIKIRDALKKS